MLEELQRRNYSEGTTRAYLQAVQQFAVHFEIYASIYASQFMRQIYLSDGTGTLGKPGLRSPSFRKRAQNG
jgi:hypothetical protein